MSDREHGDTAKLYVNAPSMKAKCMFLCGHGAAFSSHLV